MTAASDEQGFRELAGKLAPGSKLLRVWPLTGGFSARVTGLELELPDGTSRTVLVRQHGKADLRRNPDIARDEFRLLEIARSHQLAAPQPLLLDESRELFPDPVLVVEFVEGATELAPPELHGYLSRMADELLKIHAVPATAELDFLPRYTGAPGERPAELDHSLDEGIIRDALEAAGPPRNSNPPVLLHGDYWPGNILWRDGRIVAVIDWEDAATGDPLDDLGNTRMEILWAFGRDAMEAFTGFYLSRTSISPDDLPIWDLRAALRPCSTLATWGLDPATETRMRALHQQFVGWAVQQLG